MLASRYLRLSAIRLSHPSKCVWAAGAPLKMQQPTKKWCQKFQIVAYSKDTKPAEKPIDLKSPTTENISQSLPFSTVKPPKNTPTSSSSDAKLNQEIINKCSAGSFGKNDVKLPSREQVESFVFKTLVYLWDFTFYVICLTSKLIESYIINNSTVQHYWKLLLKRMEDARKELKSK